MTDSAVDNVDILIIGAGPVGLTLHLALAAGGTPDAKSDILNALLALGYNEREALGAMKGLAEDIGVSDGIRQALKLLSKG